MTSTLQKSTVQFRRALAKKGRQELLEILEIQDPRLVENVKKIEEVFATKLGHLEWPDGTPITSRPVTKDELVLMVDEPFQPDQNLSKMGITIEQQKKIHMAKDPVLFAKYYLGMTPRAYQVMVLRDPHASRILRMGRRIGKTVTLTIDMLHFCFTNKKAKVIVLAPAKVQVQEIFKSVMEILDASTNEHGGVLGPEFIERSVQNPNLLIEFKNGSSIKFFTTGVASASRADAVRGQEADLVVLDEMDYMHPDDFKAILALVQGTDEDSDEQKRLIGASTPKGTREQFYEWSTNPPPGFASFYFPSYVNPKWTPEVEALQRHLYKTDMMGYRHEFEADFGDQAEGVYPRKFLDPSFVQPEKDPDPETGELKDIYPSWEYHDELTHHQSEYVIGVDWNKFSAGTMICVLEVLPKNYENPYLSGKIRLCHREEIGLDEYSLTNAVDRLIVLNKRFNPRWIYVDQGYGEVQVELLKKHGNEHRSTGLHRKVVAINSSAKPEIRDPVTGEKEGRPYKTLMVNALRDMMEENKVLFPHHDDALYAELGAYIMVRETPTGEPVFGPSGKQHDHVHDALALAALAITEKMSIFAKKRRFTQPIAVDINSFNLGDKKTSMKDEDINEPEEKKAGYVKRGQDRTSTTVANSGSIYRYRSMSKQSPRSKRPFKRKMF